MRLYRSGGQGWVRGGGEAVAFLWHAPRTARFGAGEDARLCSNFPAMGAVMAVLGRGGRMGSCGSLGFELGAPAN